ncbi:MAG TPA: thioredoxin [Nitrospirales bacterium]
MGKAIPVSATTWETEVGKASGLVLVDFWAVWCGPCQMIAPCIEELATEYDGKLKVVKLNTDENPDIAGKYGIMSIPTLLFFRNGQPVEKVVGAVPKRLLKEAVDNLLKAPTA